MVTAAFAVVGTLLTLGIVGKVDHIVPISAGGSNDIGNIQPLFRCNRRKSARTVDYRSEGFYLREVDSQGNITDLGRHLLIE